MASTLPTVRPCDRAGRKERPGKRPCRIFARRSNSIFGADRVFCANAIAANRRVQAQRFSVVSEQSKIRSFSRTAFMRSSGKTPIAPLMTDRWSVVSLSTRIQDGLLRPVCRHFWCPGVTATVRAEGGVLTAEVMNATRKLSGASHCASTRQGRRLALLKSLNGNAA